jgi:hypothetical protein
MTDIPIDEKGHADPRRFLRSRDAVSFNDVVAQRKVGQSLDDPDYRSLVRRFEAKNGEIIYSYYSDAMPVGVAVTIRRRRMRDTLWLYRKTELLARRAPDFARLLLRLDREAVRVSNVLAGMSQRIAMSNLYSLAREITAYLEAEEKDASADAALASYTAELASIEGYSAKAARRQAQIIYLNGMLLGLAVLLVLAPLLAVLFGRLDVPGVDAPLFIACLIAGSVGAVISVLMRMSGDKFNVDHQIGREYVTKLGVARPFIGAIFALLIYFAFQGQLLQQIKLPDEQSKQFAFYVAAGFVIGFSERLAKDIVQTAEGSLGGPAGVAEAAPR